ncbi:MAG: hypothetical protein ACTSXH_04450, partial [Promethearchaeota archaeon]
NISKEILANCGILACFQTHFQKDLMVELLNLEEEQRTYISMLKKGTCILRVNSIEKPFVLEVPLVKRKRIPRELIELKNQAIINQLYTSKRKSSKFSHQIIQKINL